MSLEIGSQAVHQRRGAADCGNIAKLPELLQRRDV